MGKNQNKKQKEKNTLILLTLISLDMYDNVPTIFLLGNNSWRNVSLWPVQGTNNCVQTYYLSHFHKWLLHHFKYLNLIPFPCPDQEADEMTMWLQHNISPTEKVNEYMLKTAHSRYTWIREGGIERPNVGDILQKYPRLLEPGMVRFLKYSQIHESLAIQGCLSI